MRIKLKDLDNTHLFSITSAFSLYFIFWYYIVSEKGIVKDAVHM